MNNLLRGIIIICLGGLFTMNSFAATGSCTAINQKTGQVFTAGGGGPWQGRAIQVARQKAMWKCHNRSRGWPGACIIQGCARTY